MKSKTDLYRLIKAMSKSEKRYFTLDAQKSGRKDTKYLELFYTISSMDKYDEEVLKKKFPKHLSTDKAYLYDAILRSMRDYRSSKSRGARIKEKLLDAKYLYERGLYDLCEESLTEAKKLSDELGDYLALLEINKEERRLVRDAKAQNFEEELEQLTIDKEKNLSAVTEEFYHLDIQDKIFTKVVKHFQLRDAEKRQAFLDDYKEEFSVEEKPFLSKHSEWRFYQNAAMYYQLLGNYDKVFHYFSKALGWWDNNPKIKEEDFHIYIVAVSNYLYTCYLREKLELMEEVIEKLEAEKVNLSIHNKGVLFQKTTIYRQICFINLGKTKGIAKLEEDLEEGIKNFDVKESSEIVITFNMAVIFFIAEQFDNCIKWCTKIMKGIKTAARQDIQRGAYILWLFATYEQQDIDKFEAAYRSTYRFFNQKTTLEKGRFEFQMIDLIKKIATVPLSSYNESLQDMQRYLQEVKQSEEKIPLGLDELLTRWLESKTKKRPIYSIIQSYAS